MIRNILLGAVAVGTMLTLAAPAQAREGCGRGEHRGPHGRCLPANAWTRAGHHAWVEGRFYRGHGYWHGGRWWQHRDRDHDNWRYR